MDAQVLPQAFELGYKEHQQGQPVQACAAAYVQNPFRTS